MIIFKLISRIDKFPSNKISDYTKYSSCAGPWEGRVIEYFYRSLVLLSDFIQIYKMHIQKCMGRGRAPRWGEKTKEDSLDVRKGSASIRATQRAACGAGRADCQGNRCPVFLSLQERGSWAVTLTPTVCTGSDQGRVVYDHIPESSKFS